MKKLISVLMIVLSISLVGCSSDDSGGSTGDSLYLKFSFEGQNYNFEPSTLTSLQKVILGNEDVNDVITTLVLEMPENPSVGTFTISDATPTDANLATLHGANLSIDNATYRGNGGSLKITSVTDEYIIGTFNFTGVDENGAAFTVTNGSFKAYN